MSVHNGFPAVIAKCVGSQSSRKWQTRVITNLGWRGGTSENGKKVQTFLSNVGENAEKVKKIHTFLRKLKKV